MQEYALREKQKISANDNYGIVRIEHISDAEEQGGAEEYYLSVGLKENLRNLG